MGGLVADDDRQEGGRPAFSAFLDPHCPIRYGEVRPRREYAVLV